jgi:NTE family protein
MASPPPTIALALQGGGSHGAFTWGVLDRLLEEVAADRLRISAISGSSAGAINAALAASGLVLGGADIARRKLVDFWRALSRRGLLAGNSLFYGEPNIFGGFNLDFSSHQSRSPWRLSASLSRHTPTRSTPMRSRP